MITWDEAKRRVNLRTHGFDFLDAHEVFDDLNLYVRRRSFGLWRAAVRDTRSYPLSRSSTPKRVTASTSYQCERRRGVSGKSTLRTSRTDWKRVAAQRDRVIKTGRGHPEADPAHIVRGIVRQGLKAPPAKESISLRIDPEVLGWFRAQGSGWQTRMNAVLRAYKEAASRSRNLAGRSARG